MKIENNSVVSFEYTLKDSEGNLIDSSEGESLSYIQGTGNIIIGLENEMQGRQSGDQFKVSIPAKDGYGEYKEELVQKVPKQYFDENLTIAPGMQFQTQNDGQLQILTVLEVENENVIMDGNHPLAGFDLNFDVKITEVRSATEEELEHGHVHGPGGHHHH
ncbi:MAG: peptidylprolyl isomerase [Leptospiraceae bacterium]|nr:peptidylprolyl isomerase [Leptospiraceae bacterium]MCP5493411.1 peptidylprolyl isomerase [Leptospiraceae bacterium]